MGTVNRMRRIFTSVLDSIQDPAGGCPLPARRSMNQVWASESAFPPCPGGTFRLGTRGWGVDWDVGCPSAAVGTEAGSIGP